VFFLYDDADETQRLPLTSFIRFASLLIEETEEMGFPPFSGDGRYLEVQYVGQMEDVLGSPRDDSLNAFTARMLLLLESQPVYNEPTYGRLMKRIVGFYYRDFSDHSEEFLPTVLLNDILRFWRTLTLNYEHHRLKLAHLVGEELERKKADSALKNYKLKVSRLATCYSMVASLSAEPVPVKPETVLELCRITPAERFDRLRAHGNAADRLVDELREVYAAFLANVQRPEKELLDEFAVAATRKQAHADAKRYGDITPYAHAFTVPLDPATLIGQDAHRQALEIAVATQAGSETAVPPYLDVDRRDSVAMRVNLQLLRELATSVSEQMPTVILQMTRHRFLTGLAAELAADYAAAGARRVVIRVRGLQSQRASAQELAAYLEAIEAFERRGVATVGDCAGILGPVLVAGGASGFTTGTRFFRSVPGALVQRPGGGGGVPVAVQLANAWTEVPRPAEQDVRSTRVANMQALRGLTALAASDPEALIASLRRDGGVYPALWAGVLAGRRRRAV
jgi:hypothetical protein